VPSRRPIRHHQPGTRSNSRRFAVTRVAPRRRACAAIEAGILFERTGYARNRVFTATDALTVINRPFGQEAVVPEG
jgi:hypothetical protein